MGRTVKSGVPKRVQSKIFQGADNCEMSRAQFRAAGRSSTVLIVEVIVQFTTWISKISEVVRLIPQGCDQQCTVLQIVYMSVSPSKSKNRLWLASNCFLSRPRSRLLKSVPQVLKSCVGSGPDHPQGRISKSIVDWIVGVPLTNGSDVRDAVSVFPS